ncbi:MAG: ribonuclease [Alphaproteobacteria bacterium]|jgi:ribonuclease T2|nr:ribonuclease [Alphaproteobacteria bacterium]
MHRIIIRAAAFAAFVFSILLSTGAAPAQDRRQNQAGEFDFYVLALSWSPSFCDAAQERSPTRQPDQQCGDRPFSFVVHGLWPQYEKGFPEFCQVPAPRLDRGIVSSMLDLMPSPRLIFQEWDRHGTCAGLAARAYFDNVRKARAVVKIPPEYLEPASAREVNAEEVEQAFIKANPGLPRGAISIACDSKRMSEVRICLSKDFHFRECSELKRRACQRPHLVMPAVRGGAALTAR